MHGMTSSDQMFSVRKAPWHMGETRSLVLEDHPDPDDVLRVAGLDWRVLEAPVFRQRVNTLEAVMAGAPSATMVQLGGYKMLFREDTQDILHVTKDSYTVAQNEVGAELMDALLGSDSAVKYETGGSIKSGAQCYLTALIDEPVVIDGDISPVFPYGVVTWTHDGSGAVNVRATNVRVVCWNTLSLSEAEAARTGRRYTFRHTKNMLDRVADAKAAIMGIRQEHKAFVELANELAGVSITDETREDFIREFIPAPASTVVISDRVLDNITKARAQVRGLFGSDTIPEAHRNTAYGLVLAGGEYLDHLRGFRSSDTYLGRTLLRDEPLKAKLMPMVRELVNA